MKKDKETLVDEIEKLKEAFRQIKISLIKEFEDILIKIFPDYKKYLKHIYILQIIFLLFMTCLLIK